MYLRNKSKHSFLLPTLSLSVLLLISSHSHSYMHVLTALIFIEQLLCPCCCSVTKSSPTLQPPGLQHTRLPCPSLFPRDCSNSCRFSRQCYLTISSSGTLFYFYFEPFPTSGSFPMSWLFALGGQSMGASASASVLPMNIQGWFPLGLTGLISLQSKGLSRVFSSTTIRRHPFFGAQPSLWSDSHICT